MTLAILCALIALHATFAWGRVAVFRIDGETPTGVRVIEVGTLASVVIAIILIAGRAGPNAWGDGLAWLLMFSSGALFAWGLASIGRGRFTAAFSADIPDRLITQGPYRRIRNPFYLSYILAHAVPMAAARTEWAFPGFAFMAAVYFRAALQEERKFRASPLAEDWRTYERQAGRFLPRFGARARG